MYQGEANVAEEDLCSFLEVAEDLNVKGLSKGNMVSLDSNEEGTSHFTPQEIYSLPKIDENVKSKEQENDIDSIGLIPKFEQKCNNFINNDTNGLFDPTEVQSEVTKNVDNSHDKQNTISTLAVENIGI